MTALLRAWFERLRGAPVKPSFEDCLERELRHGDAVRLHVSTLERSLGRSRDFTAGSESPAAIRMIRNRG